VLCGVGIFVKSNLKFKLLPEYSIFVDRIFETIFMEVILPNNSKYIIGSVYRPGSTHPTLTPLELFNEFSDLFSTLLDTLSNLPNLLIFGDLNIDVLQFGSNVRATDFVEHIFSYGLLQLVTKPTRCNDNSATLIDHIISKVNLPFFDISIITSRISDHFPVILSLLCTAKNSMANKTISKRSFSKTNIDKFKEALNNINWNVVRDAESIQLSYNIFADIFINFYELYFPLRDVKFNKKFHKIEPWFTKGLLVSRNNPIWSHLYPSPSIYCGNRICGPCFNCVDSLKIHTLSQHNLIIFAKLRNLVLS